MTFKYPYEVLAERAKTQGRNRAIGVLKIGKNRFDEFQFLSWSDVFKKVQAYGLYLNTLGLVPGDRIALFGRNSLEWLILDWAAVSTGLVTVPLFAQSHLNEVNYILQESEAKAIFVDEESPAIQVRQISFSEVDEKSFGIAGDFLPTPLPADDVCSIVYTSGTSGTPKGVMHSIRNFFEAVDTARKVIKISSKDRLFSYLPLSHVAERVLVEFGSLFTGAEICICDRVEKAIGFLPKARPTIFFAVPRVWETLRSRIEKDLRSNSLIQERLQKVPFFLRSWILGRFLKKKLGLDSARLCVSGAAKIAPEVIKRFGEWGVSIYEAYGLTETLCVSSINFPKGSNVGRVYPGVQCRIEADGEIVLKAPFHFKGYYLHPELDAEVLTDGWFHTGDLGEMDSEGNLKITDRKKNIFKGSNGKYIAPLAIESLLREHPSLSEVVVIGENKPHCIAVGCLESETDEGSILKHLEYVNSRLASHEQIKAVGLCRRMWSTDSGEMTASMKVKRKAVMEIYDEEIKELYETSSRVRFF